MILNKAEQRSIAGGASGVLIDFGGPGGGPL